MLDKGILNTLVTTGPVRRLNLLSSIEAIRRGDFDLIDLEKVVTPRPSEPGDMEHTLPVPRLLQNLYRLDRRVRDLFITEIRGIVSPSQTTITRFHAVRTWVESMGMLADVFQGNREWEMLDKNLIRRISLDLNRIGYQLFNNYGVYIDFLDASEKATGYPWADVGINSLDAATGKKGQGLKWLVTGGYGGEGRILAALVDGFGPNNRISRIAAGEILERNPDTTSALRMALSRANHRIFLKNAIDLLHAVSRPAAAAVCLNEEYSILYTCCTSEISVAVLNNQRFRVIRNLDPVFNQLLGVLSLRDRDLLVDSAQVGPGGTALVYTEGIYNALDQEEIRVILSLRFPANMIANLIVNAARFREIYNSWGLQDMTAFVIRRR